MKLSPLLSLPLTAYQASAIHSRRIPDILAEIKQSNRYGDNSLLVKVAPGDDSDVQTLSFEQTLDHTANDSKTFRQRYFYTDRYVHGESSSSTPRKSAAFLCVGGEGPSLDTSVLVDSVHCTGDMIGLATELYRDHAMDIHLFALEHRYYGESFPLSDGSDYPDYEDLTYLSSRQAVQDVVQFVQSDETARHLGGLSDVKWITFGGSYPGMLSAWSRLLYPSIIHGAVSSSAPLQATLDFSKYYDHVAWDLADETVGGSDECHKIFEEGHAQVVDALEGRPFPDEQDAGDDPVEYIANLFDVCDGVDAFKIRRNVEVFMGDGIISGASQGNDPSCNEELCNIRKFCDALLDESKADPNKSSMQILAKISSIKNADYSCVDADWEGYINFYSSANQQMANTRSWLYQTCIEFGFYQTCPKNSNCPYGKGYHTVDRDLELCQKIFDISPEDVESSIQSTLEYYGGWDLTPSPDAMSSTPALGPHLSDSLDTEQRILFVNGDVDPWSELGVSKLHDKSGQSVINVVGASHHFWTHKIQETDGEAIVDARQQIYNIVSPWLGVDYEYVSITAVE